MYLNKMTLWVKTEVRVEQMVDSSPTDVIVDDEQVDQSDPWFADLNGYVRQFA